MTDFVSKFITSMVNAGIVPKSTHHIQPSDRFKRIQQETDKGGKRSISYWLKTEYDFAYGYAKDFKTGQELRFNSAAEDPSMTRADIARVKAVLKARKAEEDLRIAERHAKIAIRAAHKWSLASKEGTTPYLERKNIKLHSARIYGANNVIVPILEAGKEIVSYQLIRPDGSKEFPFGGKKTGCYHIIGQINPTKPIIICEGFATGVSLYEAISAAWGQGVVVAFDAGNLLPVARSLRNEYKNTPFIVAADNDPAPYMTGQKAAAKVQKSVSNVSIVMPKTIGHDFNDLGPDEIKKAFGIEDSSGGDLVTHPQGDLQSNAPVAINGNDDWTSNLILDAKGMIVATSLQNSILHLIYHQDFKGVFAFDEFKRDTLVVRCPPWEDDENFKVDSVSDLHITMASATLERYGITSTIDKTAKAIDVAANENKFHSARQYFSSLEWDGVIRLESFLSDTLGIKEESPEYLSFVFKKWMTAAVKRVMEPGCKFDHVLILEGQKQGLYKSQFLKTLATFNGESYHSDSVSMTEISNKDTILKLQGNMIIELAELAGFSKKDDNVIKNWITQTVDEVRLPYARKTVIYPRQFIFAATTNNYDYLKDPTGGRRYWPITIDEVIDIDMVEEVKGMLWAEAVYYYNDGLYIGPTPDENALADVERQKRLQSDAWEDKVLNIIKDRKLMEFKTNQIIDLLNLKMNEKNDQSMRRVTAILKANGYSNNPQWCPDLRKSIRVWRKIDEK